MMDEFDRQWVSTQKAYFLLDKFTRRILIEMKVTSNSLFFMTSIMFFIIIVIAIAGLFETPSF